MTAKPDDIPQDVWNIVQPEAMKYVEWIDPQYEHYDEAEHVLSVSFSRAIMAEREACASLADRWASKRIERHRETGLSAKLVEDTLGNLAAAIRNRGAA